MSQPHALRLISLVCCALGAAHAADTPPADPTTPATASTLPGAVPDKGSLDRSGVDPTRLYNFAGAAYEQNTNQDSGSDFSREVVKGQFVFERLAVRAAVPVNVRSNPGRGETDDGFGDIVVGVATAKEIKPTFAAALSLDVSLNTAEEDQLGSNSIILIPGAYGSYRMNETSRIVGGLRWEASVYTESDVGRTNRFAVPVEWLHAMNQGFFVAVGPQIGYDFEAEHWSLTGLGSIGMVVAQRHTFRLSLEEPVDSRTREAEGRTLSMNYAYNF